MRALATVAVAVALTLAPIASAQSPAAFAPPVQMTDPAPDGIRIDRDGLIGNWFPAPGNKPAAAILLLGGSEGALGGGSTRMARALHADGFAVLQLSYYRAPGQSPTLAAIPLELFDRALDWIVRQPGVAKDRLAIVGGSKGAEAALLAASRNPRVRAVAVGMPSSVVWPGISWTGYESRSSWTVGGQPLPPLPYGAFGQRGLLDAYANGLATLSDHPASRIAVKRIRGRILLVCGEADALWPSCPMARQVVAERPDATLLAYADAGHAVFGVPLTADDPGIAALGRIGGSGAGNQAARIDGWPKVLRFLHEALDRR